MKIVRTAAQLPRYPTTRIGFVPTMGAFHEGHLSLIRTAKKECGKVIVSLFVNPLQFAAHEDLGKYPRNEQRDAELAAASGADVLFAPTVEGIYPRESTRVHVPEVTERWEGAVRPDHFDGVATVVAKLFHMVSPHAAYFGLKDLQQCQVIRRMAEDLNLRITLRLLPTVREEDGLAMSSRNVYLTADERAIAPELYQALLSVKKGVQQDGKAGAFIVSSKERLKALGFSVDYLALVALPDMNEVDCPADESAIIVAARLGKTRLIDNLLVQPRKLVQ